MFFASFTRTFTQESKFVFQMHFIRFSNNKKGGHLHTPIIRTLYTHSIIFFNSRAVEASLTFIAITAYQVEVGIGLESRAPCSVTIMNSCAAVVSFRTIQEGGNATFMILCFYIAASYKQYIICTNAWNLINQDHIFFFVFLYVVNIAALDFLITHVDQNSKNVFYLRTWPEIL